MDEKDKNIDVSSIEEEIKKYDLLLEEETNKANEIVMKGGLPWVKNSLGISDAKANQIYMSNSILISTYKKIEEEKLKKTPKKIKKTNIELAKEFGRSESTIRNHLKIGGSPYRLKLFALGCGVKFVISDLVTEEQFDEIIKFLAEKEREGVSRDKAAGEFYTKLKADERKKTKQLQDRIDNQNRLINELKSNMENKDSLIRKNTKRVDFLVKSNESLQHQFISFMDELLKAADYEEVKQKIEAKMDLIRTSSSDQMNRAVLN